MNCRVMITLITFAACLAAQSAHGATLLPTEDGFGYQFLPAIPVSGGGFEAFLPVGITPSGHSTQSALKFDLSGLGLNAASVSSATLDLFVGDTTATTFGANPSPGQPISVSLFALGAGAWSEATLTWGNMPALTGPAYDTLVIDGFNESASFDVTALVKDWLDGTVTNNGLVLVADAAVGGPPWVYAVFASSETQSGPQLNVVPEPTGVALALCAVPALVWYGRRRFRGNK
jgi:hypothetical protein